MKKYVPLIVFAAFIVAFMIFAGVFPTEHPKILYFLLALPFGLGWGIGIWSESWWRKHKL